MNRSSQIIRTSVIGIMANVLLAAFKAVVGAIAGSVAIVMDAVNNLSDALSSVITIVGTKLSQRPPDRKHPFGFGRIEYFSAILIAVLVLSAGITSLIESVKKIAGSGDGKGFCTACFDAEYPTEIPSEKKKNRFEQKISENEGKKK